MKKNTLSPSPPQIRTRKNHMDFRILFRFLPEPSGFCLFPPRPPRPGRGPDRDPGPDRGAAPSCSIDIGVLSGPAFLRLGGGVASAISSTPFFRRRAIGGDAVRSKLGAGCILVAGLDTDLNA